jgi:V/A-type H+-transporting ATPase subunit C
MAQGYGYGNARLRARRSQLLTEGDYTKLLAKETVEELITALTETPYKEDIEAALVRVSGVRCVFEALRINLTHTLGQVREFFKGEPRTLVGLLLRRWDRHNLLAILRGQSQGLSSETVLPALVPVGRLDEVALRELARQPSLRAVIDLMTIWKLPYASILRQAQVQTGTIPDLDQLELALNRFHYASIQETLGQGNGQRAIVLGHIRTEIDLINLSTALRLARLPDTIPLAQRRYNAATVSPLLIEPGGYLGVEQLAKQVAEVSGLEELVRQLSDTRYGPALEAGWRRYQAGEGGIAVLERELERWHAKYLVAMFTRDALSIAIPIGYLGCKEVEVANLRLLAQATAWAMDRKKVRKDLIVI